MLGELDLNRNTCVAGLNPTTLSKHPLLDELVRFRWSNIKKFPRRFWEISNSKEDGGNIMPLAIAFSNVEAKENE